MRDDNRFDESMDPMIEIGQMNLLEIVKEVEFGLYLDGGEDFGEILLPRRYMPKTFVVGEKINVFIYCDSEDRIIATTEKPIAMVGDFAALKVVSVNNFGAFLDWGLPKDLLLPYSEQKRDIEVGKLCVVRIFLDESTGRVAASAKIDKFLNQSQPYYRPSEEVDLLIAYRTDLGFAAIINGEHIGMLFEHEIFEPIKSGDRKKGYVKKIREDGKIDLSLYKLGYEKVGDLSDTIIDELEANGGFLPITDKTSPAIIYDRFGVSKKTYKKAIGSLYKRRLIVIEAKGVRLAA